MSDWKERLAYTITLLCLYFLFAFEECQGSYINVAIGSQQSCKFAEILVRLEELGEVSGLVLSKHQDSERETGDQRKERNGAHPRQGKNK